MITAQRLFTFIAVLPLIASAAPDGLQKDMPFAAARKLLLKDGWKPINVHAHDDYAPMGVEHELVKMKIKEFDSCSIDYSNCVMRYKRHDACLTLFTKGEKIKYMKVVEWSDACPAQPAASPSSGK